MSKSIKPPFCCTVSILQVYFTHFCAINFWGLEYLFREKNVLENYEFFFVSSSGCHAFPSSFQHKLYFIHSRVHFSINSTLHSRVHFSISIILHSRVHFSISFTSHSRVHFSITSHSRVHTCINFIKRRNCNRYVQGAYHCTMMYCV